LSLSILYLLVFIKPISNQGLACYKCMTTGPNDDGCRDPFSSLIHPVQINCQVYWIGFFLSLYNRFSYIYVSKKNLVDFYVKSNYFLFVQFFPFEHKLNNLISNSRVS
jgi:hypothetical protein